MRGLETSVVKLRHEVFKEVSKVAYDSAPENINSDIEAIPYAITPTEVPQYRESIYRERAIASERVRLAMGMSLRPADKPVHLTSGLDQSNISDKYYEPPLMQVIPSACDACEENAYEVTNQCRGARFSTAAWAWPSLPADGISCSAAAAGAQTRPRNGSAPPAPICGALPEISSTRGNR